MKPAIPLLVVLLLAQLGVAGFLATRAPDTGAFDANAVLMTVAVDRVARITIEAPDQPALELVKRDDVWRLPSLHDYPVAANKVGDFLDTLVQLKRGWPVATRADAAERFKTSDATFVRRISLADAEAELARLYLGSSPGFRQSHARVDAEPNVYAIAFNAFDAATRAEDWLDRELLKLDPAAIQRIELHGLTLTRGDQAWSVSPIEVGERANQPAIDQLVSRLANPTFLEVLGTEAAPAYALAQPALAVKVEHASGAVELRYGKPADANHYILKSSAHPYYYEVAEQGVQPLLEATRERLVNAAATDPAAAPDSTVTSDTSDTADKAGD